MKPSDQVIRCEPVTSSVELRHIEIHGHRVGYRSGGSGPVIVLIHGMAGSSATWRFVMPALAEHFTVVAPDLVGHGESEKPRGDYSLGAFASGVRDLLLALGHERATLVGQSLGGGVAMQFAYQFPERCERLVLVSSGGLGDEVNLLLRLLALPGAEFVLPLACNNWIHDAGVSVAGWLANIGLHTGPHLAEIWESYGSLADAETRTAFVHTLRSVVDVSRPTRERGRSALPRRRSTDADHLGRPRQHHPRSSKVARPTKRSRAAGSRSSKARDTSRTANIPIASATSSSSS